MNWIRLYLKLQRLNASLVIGLFVLIGAASNGYLITNPWRSLLAVAIAMLIYPAAVGFNDIADRQLDEVNVADMDDRALMKGASAQDVVVVSGVCAVISIIGAFLLSFTIGWIVIAIQIIAALYSLPPVRISFRPHFAVPWLTGVYALAPYLIGLELAGQTITSTQVLLGVGIYILFMSRIIMKDFRDREGDKKGGKVTYLLKFGKSTTIITSYILLAAGLAMTITALNDYIGSLALVVVIPSLFAVATSIGLWIAKSLTDELVAIGVIARIQNATMLLVLLDLVWADHTRTSLVLGDLVLIGLAAGNWYVYKTHPEKFVFGNPEAHKVRQKSRI